MKKWLIFSILIACSFLEVKAQNDVNVYGAYAEAHKNKIYGQWSEWSEWREIVPIPVLVDLQQMKISLYGKKTLTFRVIDSNGVVNESDGSVSVEFICLDNDGVRCGVKLRGQTLNNQQLYLIYNNQMIAFSLRNDN